MKMKKGLIIQPIDNDFYLIDSGEELPRFNGMVKLNETSNFIVTSLKDKNLTLDELVNEFLKEYNANENEIKESIVPVINQLKKIGLIIENE